MPSFQFVGFFDNQGAPILQRDLSVSISMAATARHCSNTSGVERRHDVMNTPVDTDGLAVERHDGLISVGHFTARTVASFTGHLMNTSYLHVNVVMSIVELLKYESVGVNFVSS